MILFRQGRWPRLQKTSGLIAINRDRGRWILHVLVPNPIWWVFGRREGFFSTSLGAGPLFLLVREKPSRVSRSPC